MYGNQYAKSYQVAYQNLGNKVANDESITCLNEKTVGPSSTRPLESISSHKK